MKVLMAAYTNYRVDARVRREAEALVDAGHHVTFLASRRPGEPSRETIAGVDVIKLPGLRNSRKSKVVYILDYLVFTLMVFGHLLRRPRRYHLLHINNMPDFLAFAAVVPRLLGRPVIHDVHDLMPELFSGKFDCSEKNWMLGLLRWQERAAGALASAVLTVEVGVKDILASRGISPDKIHVLLNLPDERIFAHRGRVSPKALDSPFVLVYHGTLAHRLGLDIAIEAVAEARAEVPQLQLRIIGEGEERAGLIALRDRLGLREHVSFSEGPVPVQQIPPLIADADLGVVPLRRSSGTDIMLPTKLLEYVAMGIPCIASKNAAIARYFDDSMIELCEAEDAHALAAAIVRLRNDPGRRAALSHEATTRFAGIYTWSRHKRVYTELVERLVSGDPQRPSPARSSRESGRPESAADANVHNHRPDRRPQPVRGEVRKSHLPRRSTVPDYERMELGDT